MTIKNWVRTGTACAALAGAFTATAAATDFTFDDIHHWIGEGTNRAAVVLDWNNGQPGSSLAWGVRWNGASTNLKHYLETVVLLERRLHMASTTYGFGTFVGGFAYDADGDGGVFDIAAGTASDRDDFSAGAAGGFFWASLKQNRPSGFPAGVVWEWCWDGTDGLFPQPGDWFAFMHIDEALYFTDVRPASPVHAESPFGVSVVAFSADPEYSPFYLNTDDPSTVLGAPSTYAAGWGFPDAPVMPNNQAWGKHQLFSLEDYEAPAFVTVEFDHPVVDDPQNPYGLDFIVFGNDTKDFEPSNFDPTGDPNLCVIGTMSMEDAMGIVSVSQDGITWHSFTNGPFADTFAPTMSHLYDTNVPDASLFEGNRWWGSRANPTLPVDPTLTADDFDGKTVAEYARLYNGSAGGTGFDISGFNLPLDSKAGRKWIKYIRVEALDYSGPDIDAFADVAPALPYDNWAREHYAWTNLPDQAVAGKEAIAANGKPNFYNAAFGTAPDATPVEAFKATGFAIENGRAVFRVPSAEYAFDAFRIGTASVVDGLYRDTLPVLEGTAQTPGGFESVFSVPVDPAAAKAFYKIGISAE